MNGVDSHQTMQCAQVWGGNQPIDTAVSMAGMDALVSSTPYKGGSGGGDVYYLSSCQTGRVARVLVADVSGHGIEVSKIAADLRDLMRRHVNTLNQSGFVRTLNAEFARLADGGVFATAVVLSVWLPGGEIVLCSAGHPRALRFRAAENEWSIVDVPGVSGGEPSNLPLGVIDPAAFDQARFTWAPGDMLVLYTDSITESRAPGNGGMLGERGLLDAARSIGGGDPARFRDELLARVGAFRGGAEPDDDQTLVVLSNNGVKHRPTLSGLGSHVGHALSRGLDRLRGDRVGRVRTFTETGA